MEGASVATLGQGRPQRGPLRPAMLATTRRRLGGVVLARRFRGLDTAALAVITVLSLLIDGPRDFFLLPLRTILPPVAGAAMVFWLLKIANIYAFKVRENLPLHLAKAGFIAAIGGAVAAVVALLLSDGLRVAGAFSLLTLGGLCGLHAVEWSTVRRWRARGLLTPNIVVVGATANASRLIEAALNARDAAILGVFDDRMSRIPSHIHGVPVIGDTQSLLTHKLLPFIDRIVITVTPTAQHRVRELIDRLKFLPNAVTLFMDVEGFDGQSSALSRLADAPFDPGFRRSRGRRQGRRQAPSRHRVRCNSDHRRRPDHGADRHRRPP